MCEKIDYVKRFACFWQKFMGKKAAKRKSTHKRVDKDELRAMQRIMQIRDDGSFEIAREEE